ncbi:MAG TPA: hypothetical protein VF668_21670 [Pyrinomonadaceae bacterium]|jgi:hypothetical protein
MLRVLLSSVLFACAASPVCTRPPAPQSATPAPAQAPSPAPPPVSRRVSGLTLTSDAEPRVRIKFAKEFKYAGGHSFVLYDVANAEQHFFVDADARGRVRRLYWVQFEGYLPTNTRSYNYKSPNVVKVGALDFVADSQARRIPPPDPAAAAKPANKISDGEQARAFLASKGYTLASDEALWQRLVHLTDASKRSELMVIYLEDLGGTGMTAADLNEGGRAAAQWESVSKALLERARAGMTIERR